MRRTLRRVGRSLVMTVPRAFVEQNGLHAGSEVTLHLAGEQMTVRVPVKRRYKLTDLLAEMPDGPVPRLEGWDEMPSVGLERLP